MNLTDCISACLRCHGVCLETMRYCLEKGGMHAQPSHVVLLLDCAEICQTSANVMLRRSAHHAITCRACAEICEACAKDCDSMGTDETMKRCAEVCRECAQSCREMARAA